MEAYKREFIQFLEGAGVLKFGDFTAKRTKQFVLDELYAVSKDITEEERIASQVEYFRL